MPLSSAPQPANLLISGGYVLTLDSENNSYYPGSVAIQGRRIVAVGPSAEVNAAFEAADRIEAHEQVVMPGLVNIHGHASNSLIRGLGGDLSLHDWLENVCWPYMDEAEDEDLYNGVLLSCLEMLGNGVTTFADMWVGVSQSAEAVRQSGLRAVLAHNIKDFGDTARGEEALATAVEAWRQWHGYAEGRVTVGLGPHSVYTCRPELLADCAKFAREEGLHVQIHGSETAQEVAQARVAFGRTPIALMDEVGLLGEGTIVAHAVHLDDDDVERLQRTGTAVAHNIASNLKLASGMAPVHRYLAADICVGMGTDGPGSNNSLDLLGDLKFASMVQKTIARDATAMPAETALAMITRNGAAALGLEREIGSLEVGKRADIILIDLDRPHFTPRHFDHEANILSHLVYCATGADVSTMMVDGHILMRNRELTALDAAAIRAAAQASSERLLARAGPQRLQRRGSGTPR